MTNKPNRLRSWVRYIPDPEPVETTIVMPDNTPPEIVAYVKDLDKSMRERALFFPRGVLVSTFGFPGITEGIEGLLFFSAPAGLPNLFKLLKAIPGDVDVAKFREAIQQKLPTLNTDSYLLVLVCMGVGVFLMENRKIAGSKGGEQIIH